MIVKYLSIIYLIVFCRCYAAENDFIRHSELDGVTKIIVSGILSRNLTKEAESAISKYWYVKGKESELIVSLQAQMNKISGDIASTFGVPSDGMKIIGSMKVGQMLSIFYYRNYSNLDVPVKISYVRKDDGYHICGLAWGSSVLDELGKFTETKIGGIVDDEKTQGTIP